MMRPHPSPKPESLLQPHADRWRRLVEALVAPPGRDSSWAWWTSRLMVAAVFSTRCDGRACWRTVIGRGRCPRRRGQGSGALFTCRAKSWLPSAPSMSVDAGQVLAELVVLGAQLRDFLVGQFKTAVQRFLAGAAAGLPGGRLDARLRRSCSICSRSPGWL